jgi:ABC-type multidrug transport system fused ATPase/permease subunit
MTGNIQFEQVRFIYPSRPTLRVLKDFNLFANAGQTTAICGPSGSGYNQSSAIFPFYFVIYISRKSTCVALLLRFYDPYTGTILLDGHDIRTLSLPWLRSQVGFVQQEPVLFNLSVSDNIAYGDNTRIVSQSEIEAAAKKANIHEAIISLPEVN